MLPMPQFFHCESIIVAPFPFSVANFFESYELEFTIGLRKVLRRPVKELLTPVPIDATILQGQYFAATLIDKTGSEAALGEQCAGRVYIHGTLYRERREPTARSQQ
jgi:hypothetical protein